MQNKLRILIILVSLSLVFVFGFSWVSFRVNPVDITKYLAAQVGSSMGVSVSVSENPFNTLAQQLEEKEAQLQEREKALEEKGTEPKSKDFSSESNWAQFWD
jgi:hypothetical protein